MVLPFLKRLTSSRIRSECEVRSYVFRTTALCLSAALAFDIFNQLTFFISWPEALRSWLFTIGIVVAIATPVTRTIGRANLALYRASRIDPLTGLLNRRALFEDADDASALMVLMIVDVDRFKAVNDTYGHMAGDDVLRAIAGMFQRMLGDLGRTGRLGGEEFALICSGGDRADLLQRLEDFREAVAQTPLVSGSTAVSVTISAGLACRDRNQSFKQLYAEADRALYRAKTSGRNRIVATWADAVAPAWTQQAAS